LTAKDTKDAKKRIESFASFAVRRILLF
jgi:hypothetical protein